MVPTGMLKSGKASALKSARSHTPSPSRLTPKLTAEDLNFEPDLGIQSIKLPKNRDVVVAGRNYSKLFVDHEGWLLRYKILHNGDRQIVDFVLPGQIFGLQACLFNTSLYSTTTITEVSLSSIPLHAIDYVIEKTPKLAKAVFWSALYDSAILGEHLIDTARRSAYERVSHLLLELFIRTKVAEPSEGMSFNMPLTQELIGSALGLTTVHVNRTLRSLREDKLIAISGKLLTILDFDALCQVSDFDCSYLGEPARALCNKMSLYRKNESASVVR
jgi:CRP-like cAMP-binding protein